MHTSDGQDTEHALQESDGARPTYWTARAKSGMALQRTTKLADIMQALRPPAGGEERYNVGIKKLKLLVGPASTVVVAKVPFGSTEIEYNVRLLQGWQIPLPEMDRRLEELRDEKKWLQPAAAPLAPCSRATST